MKELAEITIYQVSNGYQIQIVTYGEGLLRSLRAKNTEYVAESNDKLKELLQKFVDELGEASHEG